MYLGDPYPLNERDGKLWLSAKTLRELAELTALWLEGKISVHPANYGDEPDAETTGLVTTLAEMNRAGFMTESSQPGVEGYIMSMQRAFVCGFCSEERASALTNAIFPTRLVAFVYPPESWNDAWRTPVTFDDGKPFTWLGTLLDAEDIRYHYGHALSPAGLAALEAAYQVQLFDPVWGANALLWSTVLEALRP